MGSSRGARRRRAGSLVALGVGLLFLLIAGFAGPLEALQTTFTDALFRNEDGSPNIVVVGIDDRTLENQGRLGDWPRQLHAEAIEKLSDAGARVIVYDVLFADESPEDELFARAVADAGNVVLAAVPGEIDSSRSKDILAYRTMTLPTERLREAAASVAHANVYTDDDGRVRRVPLAVADQDGQIYPAASVAAFYGQYLLPVETPPPGIDSLSLVGRDVPLEERDTLRVNYIGAEDSFTAISFQDLLDGSFDPARVRDKSVFVGITAQGADRHSAPLLGNAPGVFIHANALDTLLRARFLRPVAGWVGIVIGIVFAAVAAYAVPRWRTGYAILLVVLLAAAYEVAVVVMFYEGRVLNGVDPPVALFLAAFAGLAYRVVAERAAQREVSDLFGRYVSGGVARELMRLADRGEIALGGELREVTVLFGDIRGFTTMSQGMEPGTLVETLNRQFEVIVASVLAHGGIVNKFVGDAIMAVWNAPEDQPEHALQACRAALRALQGLEALPQTGPAIRFGFGINTGPALAGNVGAVGRLEYTVMGETVNTASRLSGAAGGGETWIGERTRQLVLEHMDSEPLPPQQLKGMAAPIAVFRLLGETAEAPRRVEEPVTR